tara:strand:+ start:752 stop:1180 length:429 start_codon:yes stop_codon:yes gene_type:complete
MAKVGKEEVMGILTAVEYWAGERDDEADYQRMLRELNAISDRMTCIEGVTTVVHERRDDKSSTPRIEIKWPSRWMHEPDFRERLLEAEPRVMLDDRGAREGRVFIIPFSLQDGEGARVGQAIASVLEREQESGGDQTSIVRQ